MPRSLRAPPPLDRAFVDRLSATGLFDARWYRRRYPDVAGSAADPAEHFLAAGAAEDRWPNPHFDPAWYRATQLREAWPGHPIVHYAEIGEAAGLRPIAYFDPAWYRQRYLGAFSGVSPLGHYLLSRESGRYDPCPGFDTAWYLRENADIVGADIDPFEHFLKIGFREGRNPSGGFDLRYYQRRYLNHADVNPLLHWLDLGMRADHNPDPAAEHSPASEVRRFARPSPDFAEVDHDIATGRERLAKLVAFYLPQFHSFPENDAWWGRGFTEWTNLSRGNPRFVGHYQPRVPRDLGFYDLGDPGVMRRQVEMARAGGLHGFCFYYYNFNGKRLLHAPVERFLADREVDWPFCIMWANENWSRRWDGSEAEILIRQDYRDADAEALIDDLARHFADRRYIRLGGRPLFFVYRAGIIPDSRRTVAAWRRLFLKRHGERPLFFIAQTFNDHDPTEFGFDGAVEFPPHKILARTHQINPKLELLDQGFAGHAYDYDDVIRASLGVPAPAHPLIKTVFPSWDNDARRQGRGVVATGSTPAKYRRWLESAIAYSRRHRIEGEALVFINAWNEWAEGAYLEPDLHFGGAYLNATALAVIGQPSERGRYPLVAVISDDAPAETWEAARTFASAAATFGCELHLVRLDRGGGRQGAAGARLHATRPDHLVETVAALREAGAVGAVVFGASAGEAVPALGEAGLRTVSVITEMPVAIEARGDRALAALAAGQTDVVVAATPSVAAAHAAAWQRGRAPAAVRPPLAAPVGRAGQAERRRVARELGLPSATRLVVGRGPATLQNGVDLFAAAARIVASRREDVAFVWFGEIAADLRVWLQESGGESRLMFRPSPPAAIHPFAVADVIALTARSDAVGEIAAEAVACGAPVVAFAGSGAVADVVDASAHGRLVDAGDVAFFAAAVEAALTPLQGLGTERRGGTTAGGGNAADRAFALIRDADPTVLSVSAVLLAGDRPDRPETLAAVLGQSRPLREILVGAADQPAARSEALAAAAGGDARGVHMLERAVSGGRAAHLAAIAGAAAGDFLWVVPADADFTSGAAIAAATRALQREAVAAAWAFPAGRSRTGMHGERDADWLATESALPPPELGAIIWRRLTLLAALRAKPGGDDLRTILETVLRHAGGSLALLPAPAATDAPASAVSAVTSPPVSARRKPAGTRRQAIA